MKSKYTNIQMQVDAEYMKNILLGKNCCGIGYRTARVIAMCYVKRSKIRRNKILYRYLTNLME